MLKKIVAGFFNERGQLFLDRKRDLTRAERAFSRAAAIAPAWAVPWYNLGLVAKWQRRWRESLEWNRNAAERDPPNQPAWWNMGIAATALGDWAEARRAWTGFGIELPPGDGEFVMELGPTPIRLNPEAAGEVVWCRRLDPARAVVQNVPLPETGYRYGDLILHDGAPSGERRLHGNTVPVFDMIELLQASNYHNFEVEIEATNTESLNTLFRLATEENIGLEDWGTIRCLCTACSRGSAPIEPEENDDFVPPNRSSAAIRLMAAAPDLQSLFAVLDAWTPGDPGCRILRVDERGTCKDWP